MIRTLIIDDEKLARDIIRSYLKDHAGIEIIGECDNGFEGVKMINDLHPDLIFLDVQMPKLNGFEMLELLDHEPVIIFSTAFDQYAIKAFEKNAIDYLLKPYDAKRFYDALERAREWLTQKDYIPVAEKLNASKERQEPLDRLVVRVGSKIIIIPATQIDYIEAQDDYVAIHSEGRKYLKQSTMKYLEEALPEQSFVRVHRSYLVAVDRIMRLEALSKDSFVAILNSSVHIPVSRRGYQALREVLNF